MRVNPLLMHVLARTALSKPLVGLVGKHRQGPADAGLDPQVAAVLELARVMRTPALDSMEPAAARRFAEEGLSPLEVAPANMAEVIDTTVTGHHGPIPVRIYVPPGAGRSWIVYLHGGGGVIGSIASAEPIVRLIAAQTRCTVASVAYRLGPEHKHPAAIDDAVAAWDALVARVPEGGRIAVAGDSFGGFLSAHVDHAAARRPDLQVLIYPLVDLTLTSPSIERLAHGYLLTKAMVHWFRDHYLHATDDRIAPSPRYWPDLRGASPALVITAGFDPLVDEGDAYARQLEAAGIAVRHRHYPSLVHGFISLAGAVRAARAAVDEMCRDIVERLAS